MPYRIAVTGGPCAGKTTVMSALKEALQEDGWTEARALEQRTREAWVNHQLWSLTLNGADGFSGKVERAILAARRMLEVLDG